jgi:hypothetical protein
MKIESLGGRHNVYTKAYASRGATRFHPVSHTIQLVHKWYSPNTRCTPSSLCRWHMSICDWTQRGLHSEKTPVRSKLNGDMVWVLEYKVNEEKTRAIYFSHRIRPPDFILTLNGRDIPFVNNVKYIGVIFDKKITWRLHTEMIEAKTFKIFIRIHLLFKSEWLSTNIKLTLHKALIRSAITYTCPAWEFEAETHLLKLKQVQNRVLHTIWQFSKACIDSRYACSFPSSVCLQLHNKIV